MLQPVPDGTGCILKSAQKANYFFFDDFFAAFFFPPAFFFAAIPGSPPS